VFVASFCRHRFWLSRFVPCFLSNRHSRAIIAII
jgi:hypothetical protein